MNDDVEETLRTNGPRTGSEQLNMQVAAAVRKVLAEHGDGQGPAVDVMEFLIKMMHYAHLEEVDFDEELAEARGHFKHNMECHESELGG